MKYFWPCYILANIIVILIADWLGEPDSWLNKKKFDKRLSNIRDAYWRLNLEEIVVENKGFSFNVRIEKERRPEALNYTSPYSVTDIYINDELVCKLHKLENLFTKRRTLDYVKDRSRTEIDEIIKKACKISKQKLKEYYKTTPIDFGTKSFYKG